jgi:chemotaxis protein methyltransferase CheR
LAHTIYEKCGIDFRTNYASLDHKVNKRLKELELTALSYVGYLETHPSEWDILFELVTINETYFFREDTHFSALRDFILTHKLKKVTIWSAASSTGEEAYSLVMYLIQNGVLPVEGISVFGTDINHKVVSTAKKGWYAKNSLSFRRMPDGYLEKYFIEDELGYTVKPFIRDRVEFSKFNLKDTLSPSNVRSCDAIFCRNVLFYFDAPVIKQIINSFYRTLNDPGTLFLGHSDSITSLDTGFKTVNTSQTFYYEKGGGH